MGIQGLLNTQPAAERRRAAAGQSRTAGASFQDRLAQTASAAAAGSAPQFPAGSADSRAPAFEQASPAERDNLLDTLNAARLLLLQRTKEGREWKKEQEEWDRLMRCLDNWIEALRKKADREREGRSGDITAEGGEALMALYRGYIATAAWTQAADDPAQAKEDLLSALTAARSDLLERLKEDRADEEERQEWEDLMKRLDRWIESLRAERRDEDKRAYGASAIGVQTSADAGK